jgi:hypothetical protein
MDTICTNNPIVLGKNATDRIKAIKINQRLNNLHRFATVVILYFFMYYIINDPQYVQLYSFNKASYIIGISAWIFSALFFASALMLIPSIVYARLISPEIFMTNDYLIYLGGSVALNYRMHLIFMPFFKYLLGYEHSQKLLKDEILSVKIEEARFFKPAFGIGEWIVITHNNGKIYMGAWLSINEKKAIIENINNFLGGEGKIGVAP